MHKITKSYLTRLIEEGLTLEQIAARISKDFNETIGLNKVRDGLKLFGLKTGRNKFTFVDDTDVPSEKQLEEALAEYNPHDDLPFGI